MPTLNFAMKAEAVHARLYTDALNSLGAIEEVFYYLCPVCGNIETSVPDKCVIVEYPVPYLLNTGILSSSDLGE